MTTQTNPPKPPPDLSKIHFTFVKYRSPEWKGHDNVGGAKLAVGQHVNYTDVWIYHQVDGKLEMRWYVPKGTKRDDYPWNNEAKSPVKSEEKQERTIESVRKEINNHIAMIEELERELDTLYE